MERENAMNITQDTKEVRGDKKADQVTSLNMHLGYRVTKRLFDIIASLLAILVFSPIMLITAVAIKMEDPHGKVLYCQPRYGKNCSQFVMYKFRSMFTNAESMLESLPPEKKREWAENFKLKHDPRVTKVGAFIRKTSIDEMPQLFNVLKGDMSLVGPRPPLLEEKDAYGDALSKIMEVTPGLTGYWQAYGRSDISFEERIKMNLYYIEHRSLCFDIRIILRTAITVIRKEGSV